MEITSTPWGVPDRVHKMIEGVWEVSTPSHGGIVLSADRVAKVPASVIPFTRNPRFWEEDCDSAVPLLLFLGELEEAGAIDPEYRPGGTDTVLEILQRTISQWRPQDIPALRLAGARI